MPRPTDEGQDAITFLAGLLCGGLVIIVALLVISEWIRPNRTIDEKWTSRSITGWTNTPKKLAWVRTVEKVSKEDK